MNVTSIDGPVIVFESKDKRAKEKAAKCSFTAAAFLDKKRGVTIVVVKCLFGDRAGFFGREIAKDYLLNFDLKMKRIGQSKNGIDITVINNN